MPNQIVFRPPFRKRGQSPFFYSRLLEKANVTGSGGLIIGGSADFAFGHGPQVPSDIVVEWDLDNDGDFSEPEEDITTYVLSAETRTGRDWPSQLTGLAGPGQLQLRLDNSTNRFSYFNSASPLTQGSFSLRTGRKIRVRTAAAANPDPTPLARDRFRRSDGALGSDELLAVYSEPLANDFTISSQKATATSVGNPHMALLDVGSTDYYLQANLAEIGGRSNVVGLVYRYQDTSNYSLAVVDVSDGTIKLRDIVAGVASTVASETAELHDDMTIGVLVESTTATFYLEGVPVMSGTAIQTDETEVGIYASWAADDLAPQINALYAWDGLPAEVEGILWTGDVSDLTSSVQAGPLKLAEVRGKGWLGRLATQRVNTSNSATGRATGVALGEALAQANLLLPPGRIAEGDVVTGPYGIGEKSALDVARDFEETEFGFLFESQEGPLTFESRTARDSRTSDALFTDAPGYQFGYSEIEPLDWRREVVNRVTAGIAPSAPSGISRTTFTQTAITGANTTEGTSYVPLAITMPATVNAGDLLLVHFVVYAPADATRDSYDSFLTPTGWKDLTSSVSAGVANREALEGNRIFAKVAVGNEDSTSPVFFTTTHPGTGANTRRFAIAHVWRVTSWFGSLDNGVAVTEFQSGSNPPVIFPSWGPAPSLLIAARHGNNGLGTVDVTPTTYPLGYTNGTSTDTVAQTARAVVQSAYRISAAEVENPGAFSGDFEPWNTNGVVASATIAVRGFNGNDPINSGVDTVTVEDLTSQDEHNSIITHRNASDLFLNSTDAETYAQLVVDTYADDRPIISLGFWATKSGAYRAQAIRRRVGDKITVVADNNAGLGINADFFIEGITHRWERGVTLWYTTWDLSPATSPALMA